MGCFVSWGETPAASGLAAVTFNHRDLRSRKIAARTIEFLRTHLG
jgi:hypothetical protein